MQLPAVMCFIAVLSEAEGLSSIPDLLRVFIMFGVGLSQVLFFAFMDMVM